MNILLQEPVYFWLIAMIVFIILELPTMGITTIWFALGSLAALVAAVIGGSFWVQVFLFFAVSLITMFCFRKMIIGIFNKRCELTNSAGLIGKKAIVTEEISNLKGVGQVIVNGQEWTARAVEDDMILQTGAVVWICDIQGVKLIVKRED